MITRTWDTRTRLGLIVQGPGQGPGLYWQGPGQGQLQHVATYIKDRSKDSNFRAKDHANSPDLNSVDYCIWGVIQEPVYWATVQDVVEIFRIYSAIQIWLIDLLHCSSGWLRLDSSRVLWMRLSNSGVTDSAVVFTQKRSLQTLTAL